MGPFHFFFFFFKLKCPFPIYLLLLFLILFTEIARDSSETLEQKTSNRGVIHWELGAPLPPPPRSALLRRALGRLFCSGILCALSAVTTQTEPGYGRGPTQTRPRLHSPALSKYSPIHGRGSTHCGPALGFFCCFRIAFSFPCLFLLLKLQRVQGGMGARGCCKTHFKLQSWSFVRSPRCAWVWRLASSPFKSPLPVPTSISVAPRCLSPRYCPTRSIFQLTPLPILFHCPTHPIAHPHPTVCPAPPPIPTPFSSPPRCPPCPIAHPTTLPIPTLLTIPTSLPILPQVWVRGHKAVGSGERCRIWEVGFDHVI